jgi:hypothetical protein
LETRAARRGNTVAWVPVPGPGMMFYCAMQHRIAVFSAKFFVTFSPAMV